MKKNQYSEEEVKHFWDKQAKTWIKLSDKGLDIYRDYVSLPGFFSILPPIENKFGLDIGSGDGHNTKKLTEKGAELVALDISLPFLNHSTIKHDQSNIHHVQATSSNLPFPDDSFDFVVSFLTLMDVPFPEKSIKEAFRVLKPGGFFQFSITHPCFWSQNIEWLIDKSGNPRALACGGYFDKNDTASLNRWQFGGVTDPSNLDESFVNPLFNYTLSFWLNLIIKAGFSIDLIHEPHPTKDDISRIPALKSAEIVAFFLLVLAKK